MLVTAILGPLITARYASLLTVPQADSQPVESLSTWWDNSENLVDNLADKIHQAFTVVVPIYNPQTQRHLIEMAGLLARHESGKIVPLAVTKGHAQMDNPQLLTALERSQERLKLAQEISQEFDVEVSPTIRIDDDIALGICRASREQNANLVVIGWSRAAGLRIRLFGNLINSVFWSSHCPVAVTRLLTSPATFQKILVPVGDLTAQTIGVIRFAQILANANQAEVVLLHVYSRRTPQIKVENFELQLSSIASITKLKIMTNIQAIKGENVAKEILCKAQEFDLVVLRSVRYRTSAGLAVSEVTTQLIKELKTSIVLLGEPHS